MSKAMRKICVVTGTRAEYGLLYWLMKEIKEDTDFNLQLVVTGMHLSPEFGLTYRDIEKDGFIIDERVDMLLSSDSPVGVAKSVGLGVVGFADALERLKPDIMVVLGDRFEILAATQAALILNIPIAHIAGGDLTEAAFDESIRHSITKMSHLHFATNQESAKRIIQLGESPHNVHIVGNPGIDYIHRMEFLTRDELSKILNFQFREHNLLITFHPVTLEYGSSGLQLEELLKALDLLPDNFGFIFTLPNADPESRALIALLNDYADKNDNAKLFTSLGQLKYLSVMTVADAVVGNSSSGIYEAPSFKIPTVNIGDRQKGRLKAASVIDCIPEREDIYNAIKTALSGDYSSVINPYGDGHSSEKIVQILKNVDNYQSLIKKSFHEV